MCSGIADIFITFTISAFILHVYCKYGKHIQLRYTVHTAVPLPVQGMTIKEGMTIKDRGYLTSIDMY